MCHFITVSLPKSVNADSVKAIFESHKVGFETISNPHVLEQLEPGDLYVLTTKGHCDCGTALGSLYGSVAQDDQGYQRELKKFRKQGWSEAKIARWLEQKEATKEKHRHEEEARFQGSIHELNQWVSLITDVLKTGNTYRLCLLLHMYRGGVENEQIDILGKEKVKLSYTTPELLTSIKEDVLYEFVA